MQRAARGSSQEVYARFSTASGEPASIDDPTVAITRDDGTVLVAETSDDVGTDGERATYTLTPEVTESLDTLAFTWTAVVDGTRQTVTTRVQTVGGFYFALADLRASSRVFDDSSKYPTTTLAAARALVEQELEIACSQAFVPTYTRETFVGYGRRPLRLSRRRVRVLRDVFVQGATVSTVGLELSAGGYVTKLDAPRGSTITVAYEHGWDEPPLRVARAALLLARRWLIDGPVDDRATSFTNEDGTYSLVTPGVRGALFDVPEVNAVVAQYAAPSWVG